jgi:hypothetical protein
MRYVTLDMPFSLWPELRAAANDSCWLATENGDQKGFQVGFSVSFR